jgi:protein-disulfide isomerase
MSNLKSEHPKVSTLMTKALLTVSLFSTTLGVLALAQPGGEPKSIGSPVLVEIDGTKITLADFEQKRPSGLFNARNSFYEAERKAVDEFVGDYLLEQQAKKEKLTVSELLQRHVNDALPKDPSDEALRVYYEGLDVPQPFEAVRDQILQHLRERRIAKAKAAYVQSLRSQAAIAMRLTPPRATVSLKDAQIRGVLDAPVTVVEYADYECPYCQQIQPTLDRLEKEFKGKLAFAYKEVPLPNHPHAQKAAEAARCAGVQGKYWDYHDLLYSTKKLEVANLKETARTLQLDGKSFDKCLDSGEQSEAVKTQLAEGQALGLQGTPSFFINGRLFSGGLTYEQLAAVVEEELNAASARVTDTARR